MPRQPASKVYLVAIASSTASVISTCTAAHITRQGGKDSFPHDESQVGELEQLS